MRLPNLKSLQAFEVAGRLGSFKAASDEMHLTQGAVAQQVRNLEKELDVVLFDRHPKGLKLTKRGAGYHVIVSRAMSDLERGNRALAPLESPVRLALSSALASRWLLPRLGFLRKALPGRAIALNVVETFCNPILGEVDIMLWLGRPPEVPGLEIHCIAGRNLVAVAAPEVAYRLGPVRHLSELDHESLLDGGEGYWREFMDRDLSLQMGQTEVALAAAEEGQGIALSPRFLVADALDSMRLRVVWTQPDDTQEALHVVVRREDSRKFAPLLGKLMEQAQIA